MIRGNDRSLVPGNDMRSTTLTPKYRGSIGFFAAFASAAAVPAPPTPPAPPPPPPLPSPLPLLLPLLMVLLLPPLLPLLLLLLLLVVMPPASMPPRGDEGPEDFGASGACSAKYASAACATAYSLKTVKER